MLSNAYCFLSSMPKQRETISLIHKRIAKDGLAGYASFLSWVHTALAAKYAKKK